jgi:hypothetical protein
MKFPMFRLNPRAAAFAVALATAGIAALSALMVLVSGAPPGVPVS